jgi:membrane protein implicated in regulation of membrane protease activity
MKVRTLLLLIVLVAISVFAALNWNAIIMPTTLSLGVAVIQAPLGLVMLGILVFLTALFLVFVVYLQTSALLEARRYARELQSSRELADQAEASRFNELKGLLEEELKRQAGLDSELRDPWWNSRQTRSAHTSENWKIDSKRGAKLRLLLKLPDITAEIRRKAFFCSARPRCICQC